MLYKGNNSSLENAKEYISSNCIVNRRESQDNIRIDITLKGSGAYVAGITGNLVANYSSFSKKERMTFYIKGLQTNKNYTRKGIATLLMKEIILYAEKFNVCNIFVEPIATESIISQTDLEKFYHKFYHRYTILGWIHHRRIRFYNEYYSRIHFSAIEVVQKSSSDQ